MMVQPSDVWNNENNEAPMVRGLAANKFIKHNTLHTW